MSQTKKSFEEPLDGKALRSPKVWPVFQVLKEDALPRIKNINVEPVKLSKRLDKQQSVLKINDPESFHYAIGSILALAQIFGILPVSGVRNPSPQKLSFKYFSFRVIYSITLLIMLGSVTLYALMHMFQTLNKQAFEKEGAIADATAGIVFYGNAFFAVLLYLKLSPKWIILQEEWRAMEMYIDSNKKSRPKLRFKFWFITACVLIPAAIEHGLSLVNNVPQHAWSTATGWQILEIYMKKSHAFILSNISYNNALGIYLFIVAKYATFAWNFTDVFIMLLAIGLSERFKCLNKHLLSTTKRREIIDWQEVREDYALLSTLVKSVDTYTSSLIFLSFANNLYFICLQLLNGLAPSTGNLLSSIYFFGSFIFLIGRTVSVTLMTARINDMSKLALPALYNCPSRTYTQETQRLQMQLTSDEVALTGLRFFAITRNFLLAVAGAILTYEVVLLQFNVNKN